MGPRSQQSVMFEITQGASEMIHGDCLQGYIVHMRSILSIWRLAALWQALQRDNSGGDKQEVICVNRVVASCFSVARPIDKAIQIWYNVLKKTVPKCRSVHCSRIMR